VPVRRIPVRLLYASCQSPGQALAPLEKARGFGMMRVHRSGLLTSRCEDSTSGAGAAIVMVSPKPLRRLGSKLMAIPGMSPIQRRAAVVLLAVLVFCILGCPLVSAQSKSKLPAIDVFGGYSYLRFDSKTLGFANQLNLNGGDIEVALPDLYQGLGAVIDVSGHFTSEMEEFNFLIGPQYTFPWKGMRLYGHGLFGKARDRLRQPGTTQLEPSYLGRAIALGGGVDLPLRGRFSVRVVQADYLITSEFSSTQHNIRLSTGLIYRFGKR
jgi:hypothetical protein